MLVVADNINIMHPAIARSLEEMDPAPIGRLVRRCVAAGAQALDINTGPLSRAPQKRMVFLVETIRALTDLPLVLDTVNPLALEAGLGACSGSVIINGFSLEPEKLDRILPLAVRHGADIIGYVLGPDSRVPIQVEEMMGMAVTLFDTCTRAGLAPRQLILDPVVVPATWPDAHWHNGGVLALIRQLPELLGAPVRTIVGLSNLSSGGPSLQDKMAVEAAYLPMLAAAGLDMILANVFHSHTMAVARRCHELLSSSVFTWSGGEGR